MGTENYVVSMFQNFLHRYPTLAELKTQHMVDGEQANCFGVNGDSKSNLMIYFSIIMAISRDCNRYIYQIITKTS